MSSTPLLRTTGLVLLFLSSATAARADSVITGRVVSAESKKPVPDVVVSATSPNLEGEQVVVTDGEGQYRIPQLPPGVYSLRFDKEAFHSYSRSDIPLRLDRTVRVNVELIPEAIIDCCLYTREWSAVDMESSTTGLSVHDDALPRLSLNPAAGRFSAVRSFDTLSWLAPGTQGESYGMAIGGASPFENAYRVDGLSTNDPVLGVNVLPLNRELIESVNVLTGGLAAEYGHTTGGVIQARTRSGSNEFHASLFAHGSPGFLGGTPAPLYAPGSTLSGQNALWLQGDLGATVSGPILKDRLWIFLGVDGALSSVEHTRTLNARVPGQDVHARTPIPGTSRSFFATERSLQALGKLTYLFGRYGDHNVSLSFITTPTRSGGAGRLTVDPLTGLVQEVLNAEPGSIGLQVLDGNFTTVALEYNGAFQDKRWLVDARLAWSRQTSSLRPSDDVLASLPRQRYPETRPVTDFEPVPDAERFCGADASEQLQNCAVQDYETGGLGGFSSLRTVERYQGRAQITGLINSLGSHVFKAGLEAEWFAHERELAGADVSNPLTRDTGYSWGAFAQDSWTLADRFTLNPGLRYDMQGLSAREGGLAVSLHPRLSPRVGLIYDPLGNGRMKLFGHYAKYQGPLPLALVDFLGEGAQVDSRLVPASTHEFLAGTEYEVLSETVLGVTYTHRAQDSVIQALSRDEGNSYVLGNPGSGLASDFPKAERTYDAVTVALRRSFSHGWMAQASYTWSRLYGDDSGPLRPVSRRGGWELLPDSVLASQMGNRTGLLPYDRTHSIKLFGARDILFTRDDSMALGLAYQGYSGTPIDYLGGHPALGGGETFVLPRGSSGERTPWIHSIDTKLVLNHRLNRTDTVSFTLDVFNLFNFQRATRVDENYTHRAVLPLDARVDAGTLTPGMIQRTSGEPLTEADLNPDFKRPLQYQTPRQVRVGIRYAF